MGAVTDILLITDFFSHKIVNMFITTQNYLKVVHLNLENLGKAIYKVLYTHTVTTKYNSDNICGFFKANENNYCK